MTSSRCAMSCGRRRRRPPYNCGYSANYLFVDLPTASLEVWADERDVEFVHLGAHGRSRHS
jgi:hypothetical protein